MEWFNEPPVWQVDGEAISVTTGPQTDFWRKTHDGGIRDSGHFYYQTVTGDFQTDIWLSGQYAALYDHAGLMVRLDEMTWLKCGIEFFNGMQHASAVVTRDYSDWSVMPLAANPAAINLRIIRHGYTFEVYYALPDQPYTMLRQAFLTATPTVQVGIMCAAPTGSGFTTIFKNLTIQQQ